MPSAIAAKRERRGRRQCGAAILATAGIWIETAMGWLVNSAGLMSRLEGFLRLVVPAATGAGLGYLSQGRPGPLLDHAIVVVLGWGVSWWLVERMWPEPDDLDEQKER